MWTPDASLIVTAEQRYVEAQTEAVETYRLVIQQHVDLQAQSRRYDNGNSLASYVASTNPMWAAEAQAFVAWRDLVWAYAYADLDKVMTGQREQPTVNEFVAELPLIEWPGSD